MERQDLNLMAKAEKIRSDLYTKSSLKELQTRASRKLGDNLYAPMSRAEATKSASNTINRSRKKM